MLSSILGNQELSRSLANSTLEHGMALGLRDAVRLVQVKIHT
jgi:hypothetical protein